MESALQQLLELMRRLRDPRTGCPWDREQTFESLTRHTLEEAYEVVDCIERGALTELPGELGDLLFQIVFYAQIAAESAQFDFEAVSEGITTKLRRRHPHVFGSEPVLDASAQAARWETLKAEERARAGEGTGELAGIALALPALVRATKLQGRAARVGFDWRETAPVFDKLAEEIAELQAAMATAEPAAMEAELGDVLFTCVNLARHLGIDAERALRGTNRRFTQRFEAMETAAAAQGATLSGMSEEALEALWQRAKEELAGGRR